MREAGAAHGEDAPAVLVGNGDGHVLPFEWVRREGESENEGPRRTAENVHLFAVFFQHDAPRGGTSTSLPRTALDGVPVPEEFHLRI